jgi:hypothetical protein
MNDEPRNPETDPGREPVPADSRREFIRRMTYLAPVVTTYLLAETAYGKNDDEDQGRHRGRTSPKPKGSTPPPPPSPTPP